MWHVKVNHHSGLCQEGMVWKIAVSLTVLRHGFEFAWACGPPMGMKVHFLGRLIPNRLMRDFRRSPIAFQAEISIRPPAKTY